MPGRKTYQAVARYLWVIGERLNHECAKDEYWDGSLIAKPSGMGHYIAIKERYAGVMEPTHEELACGHEQRVRQFGKRNYYNNRRRCDACAFEALIPSNSGELTHLPHGSMQGEVQALRGAVQETRGPAL